MTQEKVIINFMNQPGECVNAFSTFMANSVTKLQEAIAQGYNLAGCQVLGSDGALAPFFALNTALTGITTPDIVTFLATSTDPVYPLDLSAGSIDAVNTAVNTLIAATDSASAGILASLIQSHGYIASSDQVNSIINGAQAATVVPALSASGYDWTTSNIQSLVAIEATAPYAAEIVSKQSAAILSSNDSSLINTLLATGCKLSKANIDALAQNQTLLSSLTIQIQNIEGDASTLSSLIQYGNVPLMQQLVEQTNYTLSPIDINTIIASNITIFNELIEL